MREVREHAHAALEHGTAHAFWLRSPGHGEIRPVGLPDPGPDDVVVRTVRSGVSRGTETLVFQGRVPPSEYPTMRAPFQDGEFLAFLRRYWEAAFEREWDRTEPVLAGAVADAGRRLARGGIFDVLSLLWPAVRVDRQEGCFSLDRSHEHDVDVTSHRRLTLSPSAFVWPHVRVNCDDPWPLAVVIPALQLLDDVSPRIPPQELLEVLRALAHDVRLSVLRLVMERPRSTQELAGLVGMSEAALNRHLRHLAAVGLVRSERDGYYVLYSARADRLTAVGPALARFLGEPARRSSD